MTRPSYSQLCPPNKLVEQAIALVATWAARVTHNAINHSRSLGTYTSLDRWFQEKRIKTVYVTVWQWRFVLSSSKIRGWQEREERLPCAFATARFHEPPLSPWFAVNIQRGIIMRMLGPGQAHECTGVFKEVERGSCKKGRLCDRFQIYDRFLGVRSFHMREFVCGQSHVITLLSALLVAKCACPGEKRS